MPLFVDDPEARRTVSCSSPMPNPVALTGPTAVRGPGAVAKRSIDVVGAAVGLVLASPVMAVAAVLVRLDTPGPAIFRQERVGAFGRRFTTYKVRTMFVDNDDGAHRRFVAALLRGEGPTQNGIYKMAHDPRITRVGRVLRRLSIDEIPQLLNVLRGEMSLVGPRPPLPSETDLYDARSWGRLACRPGITGLWQVSGRSQLGYLEMIDLDLEYVRSWSLALDARILARTPRVVLSRQGAA